MSNIKLLDLNNDWKQSRPKYNFNNGAGVFEGYQTFEMTEKSITPLSNDLLVKSNIIRPFLEKNITNETSFLDLGCANFYFGFLSNILGAKKVTGVELDKDYINIIRNIITDFKLNDIEVVEQNVQDYNTPQDIVNACAIIHWIYSCSAIFGSMENVINHFYNITNNVLIIEWIDNEDAAIKYFNHINYNNEHTKKDYNKENFLKHLNEKFYDVQFVGKTEPTREIYIAKK